MESPPSSPDLPFAEELGWGREVTGFGQQTPEPDLADDLEKLLSEVADSPAQPHSSPTERWMVVSLISPEKVAKCLAGICTKPFTRPGGSEASHSGADPAG